MNRLRLHSKCISQVKTKKSFLGLYGSHFYLDGELILWTYNKLKEKERIALLNPGITSSLPTFLSQHFDCFLHPLWFFLYNKGCPMQCPKGVVSPLMKWPHVLVHSSGALVDHQLRLPGGRVGNAQKYSPSRASHSLQKMSYFPCKSESSCASSGCKDGRSKKM